MNKRLTIFMLATTAISAISGCTNTHIARDFAVANTQNIEQQTTNPDAYKKQVEHSLNGQKAQKVIDGYHKEKSSTNNQRLLKDVVN